MAVKGLKAAVVLAAVLALGSCQVFEFLFSSVFPGTTTLLKASLDLSDRIPLTDNGSFHLRVVETGGKTYVIIIGQIPPQTNAYTALFYDDNLKFRAAAQTNSDGVMVDAAGNIAVGSGKLDPVTLVSTSLPAGTSISSHGVTSGTDGFVDVANAQNEVNFSVDPASALTIAQYTPAWAVPIPATVSVQLSAMSGLQLNGILDGGADTVVLSAQLQDNGGGNNKGVTCYFLTLTKSPFSGIANGAFDTAPSKDDLLSSSLGYVGGYILAYDEKENALVRLDPYTAKVLDSFPAGNANFGDARFAYPPEGGFFYVFDTKTRVLNKYLQWW